MSDQLTFRVTDEHVQLARRLQWSWSEMEAGAPTVDPKRPYGNRDVPCDVADILDWENGEGDGLSEEQIDRAWVLHEEMLVVVDVAVGRLQAGAYVKFDGEWSPL